MTDRAVLAQVGKGFLAAVEAVTSAETPRAGRSRQVPLKLKDFVGSAARLAWALANHGRPFQVFTPCLPTST